jgi:GntR family transcriptional regulator
VGGETVSARLKVDPAGSVPLWRQIEEGLRRLVASGALPPGELVPSVRDLARDLRVNPATVVKAFQRLVEAGLLEVRRGEGTYVAASPPLPGKSERRRSLREAAERYASAALSAGAGVEEAREALDAAWRTLFGKGDRP